MQNFGELIDKLEVDKLAKLLSLPESHIRTMKARDSIPAEYWGQIIEAAAKAGIRGVSWKSLKSFRDQRFGTARAKGAA
jgi:hypothetical protein